MSFPYSHCLVEADPIQVTSLLPALWDSEELATSFRPITYRKLFNFKMAFTWADKYKKIADYLRMSDD